MRFSCSSNRPLTVLLPLALVGYASCPAALAQENKSDGLKFEPDAGLVYSDGDFRLTAWGFAERVVDLDGPDSFRRVRQGAEFDFPRFTRTLRPALVYEIDLTNTDFFDNGFGGADGFGRRNFENLFLAVQDADNPSRFRVLFGENTHILSRDDNLPSGNLPTINRSLILEEHGSVNSFGTQWGVQLQSALSDQVTVQFAASDNRGSLNAADPRWTIGNSLSAKVLFTPINDSASGQRLTAGLAIDDTADITNRTFTLSTAITGETLGGVLATGDKLSWEGDLAYAFPLFGRATTLEGEAIYSDFSVSNSDVGGGYVMAQHSLFDSEDVGDLDLFARYDFVTLGAVAISGRAEQSAVRAGVNYNLPFTGKLVSLHFEYAHNSVSGPAAIVPFARDDDEVRLELRISLQRYVRH